MGCKSHTIVLGEQWFDQVNEAVSIIKHDCHLANLIFPDNPLIEDY